MLPRKKRVSKSLFPSHGSKKKILTSSHFSLSYSVSAEKLRFGCVISKKVASLAVDRNTLRRRIYVICGSLPKAPVAGIIVIYAKKGANTLLFAHMEKELSVLIGSL